MQKFAEFVRGAGLIVDHVDADGAWHRCPTENHPRKKNGSWKLAADCLIGWCMDYAIHTEPLTWRPERDYVAPPVDRAALARKKADTHKALALATAGARAFYAGCEPLRGGHPYLESHGLSMAGCYGLKIDLDDWLVVPVLMEGKVASVQRISPEGEKRFWPGASVKGGSYQIERRGAQLLVLCEGLATGLAIFAAVPQARIVVAFNSGNLSNVHIVRRGLTVIAADNDHKTAERIGHNPGIDAAKSAADSLGCGTAYPSGITGTDWCDYRFERAESLLQQRPRSRESEIRRSVDAEIAAAMMKNAVYLTRQKESE